MKKILTVMMVLMCGMVAFAQNSKTIAVATFDVTANAVTKDEADSITELFINELASSKKLTITDRNSFDKILKEMKFQNSDWSDKDKTAALGKAANAGLIARGSITKLGSKYTIASTIIDVNTANVKSSVRKQFNNIDEIFDLLTGFCKDLVAGMTYKIGDTGPGGGIVFNIEGNKYWEVSGILGTGSWSYAEKLCEDYNGGGYKSWYLPTKEEMYMVYEKLVKTGCIPRTGSYWTATYYSGGIYNRKFYIVEFNGYVSDSYDDHSHSVRAVRMFEE